MALTSEAFVKELKLLFEINGAVLDESLSMAASRGLPVEEVLIDQKFLDRDAVTLVHASAFRHPPISLRNFRPDPALIDTLPAETLKRHCILPLARCGKTLTVAMVDPTNIVAVEDLAGKSGCQVVSVVASRKEISDLLSEQLTEEGSELQDVMQDYDPGMELRVENVSDLNLDDAVGGIDDAPVIRIVNSIMLEALRKSASDIHIEPMEKSARLRYRIDGMLYEAAAPPKGLMAAITSRIKIMSNLDIAERRLPQDGRFKITALGKEADVRVSLLPTIHGEKVVMRILDKGTLPPGVAALGMEPQSYERFMHALRQPYGMILVTGPTGSGKTTTLYSSLRELNQTDVNIITVEDPVEYQLKGVNQVQTQSSIGLTFAAGLRSILRQDPDIVLVGEIRDLETASIAVQAALTGHLVLSTLHTNDAVSAVIRLKNMGVEPFLLASALLLTQAQRLFRRLCPVCKIPVEIPIDQLRQNRIDVEHFDFSTATFFKAKGCPKCHDIGYKGRAALMEVFEVDEDMRTEVLSGASTIALRAKATERGMTSLRDAGVMRAMRGETSVEEILRITSSL